MLPAARQRVHIDGQDGVFLVIWVDVASATAQVVPLVGSDEVLSVPFSQIRPVDGEAFRLVADEA